MFRSSSYLPQCARSRHTSGSEQQQDNGEPFFNMNSIHASLPKKSHSFFQTKLTVGQPHDHFEKEADRIADKVVNQKKGLATQPEAISSIPRPAMESSNQIESNTGSGSTLPASTLSEMQSSFNTDFRQVKIHTGAEAVTMNTELGALAFTHGKDIYFNSGQYDPHTKPGKHLLAHELTHVVQQSASQGTTKSSAMVQLYRPKSDFNFGKKDTADLAEESFNVKKDKEKKPWIEKIFIHFNQIKQDTDSDWMPAGSLFAVYNANAVAPSFSLGLIQLPLFISFPITGGKHTELYTTPGEHTVHRIEGAGYSNASDRNNEGPNKRYVKDLNSNMSFAIFFHKGEAIHRGGLDIGSHGCVHVDWGGPADEGNTEQLRRLNYHSVIGLTKIVVTYDPAILPFLCCRRYAHKNFKKGTGRIPCDKVKAESCAP